MSIFIDMIAAYEYLFPREKKFPGQIRGYGVLGNLSTGNHLHGMEFVEGTQLQDVRQQGFEPWTTLSHHPAWHRCLQTGA
jgi:hypothetical protein